MSRSRDVIFFFDNFHDLPPEALVPVCQTLRSAIEEGLRCCIAYVPQKRDIILDGNPDLNNKIVRIEVGSWEQSELS
jgi:hypothetical protein